MSFWSDPRCFGPLGKFEHNIEIFIEAARVSKQSFRFLSLWLGTAFTRVCPKKDPVQLITGEKFIIRSDLKDRLILSKHTIAGLPQNPSLFKSIRKTEKIYKYDTNPATDQPYLVI